MWKQWFALSLLLLIIQSLVAGWGWDVVSQIQVSPVPVRPVVHFSPPVTLRLNKEGNYEGLDWHLSAATSKDELAGKQAGSGMRFLVVTLRITNPLAQTVIPGSAFSYAHLLIANDRYEPLATTLPVAFVAGASEQTATLSFQVPQVPATFTLLFSSQERDGFGATTFSFTC